MNFKKTLKSVFLPFALGTGIMLGSMFVAPKSEAEFPIKFYQDLCKKYKDSLPVLRAMLFAIYVSRYPDTSRKIEVNGEPLCTRYREYIQKLRENHSGTSQTEATISSEDREQHDLHVTTLATGLTLIVLTICNATIGLRQKNLEKTESDTFTACVISGLERILQLQNNIPEIANALTEEILKHQAEILVPNQYLNSTIDIHNVLNTTNTQELTALFKKMLCEEILAESLTAQN